MIKDVPPGLHLSEEQLSRTGCKPDQKCSNLNSTLQTDVTEHFAAFFYKYTSEQSLQQLRLRRLHEINMTEHLIFEIYLARALNCH